MPLPPADPVPPTLTESPVVAPALGLHLVVFHSGGMRAVAVPANGTVRVGRSADCELRLDSPSMSRDHFAVHGATPAVLSDLGSANGTKVNGVRVAPRATVPLETGSLIEAGGTFFALQDHAPHELVAPSIIDRPAVPGSAAAGLPDVVVADPAMVQLHGLVTLVAQSSIPVLILGETGTGKEIIGSAIHLRSARADKPFVGLNCAALPESLLESELFGYEKGSFTGASQAKPGLIESAHEGTLFLDEIGEMPLATQAKLLRVLEDGALMRVGALKPRRVDVRFIAATNANIPSLIRRGAFRRDLYFRLNGITIPLPPLRERRAEIEPLAHYFLAQAAKRVSRPVPTIAAEAMRRLRSHSWPGNIRELRNVIDRAMALAPIGSIGTEHVLLDPELATDDEGVVAPLVGSATPTDRPPAEEGRLVRMDAESERQLIVRALDACGGNQSQACKILGISRRTLLHRLDAHDIKRPRKGRE